MYVLRTGPYAVGQGSSQFCLSVLQELVSLGGEVLFEEGLASIIPQSLPQIR